MKKLLWICSVCEAEVESDYIPSQNASDLEGLPDNWCYLHGKLVENKRINPDKLFFDVASFAKLEWEKNSKIPLVCSDCMAAVIQVLAVRRGARALPAERAINRRKFNILQSEIEQ